MNIRLATEIAAPPDICFDLARSVDAHLASAKGTGERAVGGVTSGLLESGDEVTWQARHLGIRWHLTSRITSFDRPRAFRDEMVRGPFARLVHDHHFLPVPAGTTMIDEFDYALPWGWLGRIADRVAVHAHLRRFLQGRAQALKQMAEGAVR